MFNSIPLLPVDPILGLVTEFELMSHPDKVNLGVGIYLNDQGKSSLFPSVREAEKRILEQKLNKSYFPIQGDPEFLKLASKIVFGDLSDDPTLVHCQSVGGTSALSLAGRFLYEAGFRKIFIPKPTWPNHPQIFKAIGFDIIEYDYPSLDGLRKTDSKSFILAHACCHNPTGNDLSQNEWKSLFKVAKEGLSPILFDNAYQGLGENFNEDAWAIRTALKEKISLLVATSFSKNFGLYGERVGILTVKGGEEKDKERLLSYLKSIVRVDYSNPPLQGARIVKTILASPELKTLWETEVKEIRDRLFKIRKDFSEVLPQIKTGLGLFALTGFNEATILKLKEDYGCLMPKSGRINLSGLNTSNFERVKKAFLDVM